MQFLGFQSKETVREYSFQVREAAHEPREFTLTIDQDAFTTRLLRFQKVQDAEGHALFLFQYFLSRVFTQPPSAT